MDPSILGVVTAMASVVAALAAAFAAGASFWQVRMTRLQLAEQHRPYLSVWLRPDPADADVLVLVVRNEGTRTATDARLELDPPRRANIYRRTSLEDDPMLAGTLPAIQPGAEMSTYFDSLPLRVEAAKEAPGLPLTVTATLTYSLPGSAAQRRESFILDARLVVPYRYDAQAAAAEAFGVFVTDAMASSRAQQQRADREAPDPSSQ